MAGTQPLSALLQQTTLDDHEEILKAANSALKKSKTDLQAQNARVIACLKLDRWDDAFRAFSEAGDALKKQARVEWAYTLYKTGRFEEAQKLAGAAKGQDYSLAHVEAQAAYRAENFPRAVELYEELSAQGPEDEENDLRINSGATDAQLSWAGLKDLVRKPKPGREDLEQFETAFNAACGYLGRGELKQAQLLLQRATSRVTRSTAVCSCILTKLQICAMLLMSCPKRRRSKSSFRFNSSKSWCFTGSASSRRRDVSALRSISQSEAVNRRSPRAVS